MQRARAWPVGFWQHCASTRTSAYCKASRRHIHASTRASAHWVDTKAGDLHGITVIGPSPGIIWAHGLGGSCEADTARGIGEIVDPWTLGRTVLRLDLRGHGRSRGAHDAEQSSSQYTWREHAKDLRLAAHGSLSRAFFGGEAMGAAVALHAAAAATASGSPDAPPGIVLMRPPLVLARAASAGSFPEEWVEKVTHAASVVEHGGMDALESFEEEQGTSLVDGAAAIYSADFGETILSSLRASRRSMPATAYAAALRGHASPNAFGNELQSHGKTRHVAIAGDTGKEMQSLFGGKARPLTLRCPVLLLAVPGDPEHPVEAAEELASSLPNAELVVAGSLEEARGTWAKRIDAFLRKAWMKEYLTDLRKSPENFPD